MGAPHSGMLRLQNAARGEQRIEILEWDDRKGTYEEIWFLPGCSLQDVTQLDLRVLG